MTRAVLPPTAGDPKGAPRTRIAGWQPSGMLDWPGKLAATVFIAGCNLRCAYCHNPSLVSTAGAPVGGFGELVAYLRGRGEWLDGVVVTGGEPTTDPSLFDLLDELSSLCLPVKLDTNGTNPDVLRALLDSRLVAFVALDLKATPERYDDATGLVGAWERVSQSARHVLGSGVPHEFRTTAYPLAVSLADLPEIAATVAGGNRYVLQQFRRDTTLDTDASSVKPYTAEELSAAVGECSRFLPTSLRGA